MSRCQGSSVPVDETYTVDVRFPKSSSTRSSEGWATACGCCCLWSFFIFVFVALVQFLVMFIYCREEPGMALEILSIRDMTAYPTNSTGTTVWQVDSTFDIGLSTRNPNTVAKCVMTYRRVQVRVEYRGQTILWQEVPLGFKLQPRRSRPVLLQVEGKNFLLQKSDLGPVLEAEIRNRNVELDVYFDVWYFTNAWYSRNRKESEWSENYRCLMVATSPSNSSSSWLQQVCRDLSAEEGCNSSPEYKAQNVEECDFYADQYRKS